MRVTSLAILLGVVVVVGLYLWLGNVWVCVVAGGFLGALSLLAIEFGGSNWLQSNQRHAQDLERIDALHALRREAVDQGETLREVAEHLNSLTAMAEFAGEQAFPNFTNAVKNYKDTQKEQQRIKAQADSEERRFRETLDAAVRHARIEREKEANAAREAFRRSRQTEQTGKL